MRLRTLILSAAAGLSLASAAAAQTPSAPADAQPAATPAPVATPAPFAQITPAAGQDIVGVLTASGQFTTLLKALAATGLTPVLKNPGLTVFAPTDAAFAALPAGQLEGMMKQENLPTLQKALAFHVVNTKISAASAKGHQTKVASAAGPEIWVDGSGDTLKVNDATVLQADVAASNGTIFVIDKVVTPGFTPPTPPATEAAPAATETPATPAATSKKTTTVRKKK